MTWDGAPVSAAIGVVQPYEGARGLDLHGLGTSCRLLQAASDPDRTLLWDEPASHPLH